jgi:WG containing repeat
MHKSLFFALFTALSSCLFAQTKPDKIDNLRTRQVETYFFKKTTYDSVRFTIEGKNDTVLTERFYRNGQISIKRWKKDSSYSFNNEGLMEDKTFHLKPNKQSDSTIEFYRNGQIKSVEAKEHHVFYRSKDFHEDGSIKLARSDIYVGKYGRYSVQRDSQNRIFYTSFSDTVLTDKRTIWTSDTLFYQNGQPYLIQIKNKIVTLDDFDDREDKTIKCEFYKENGQLLEAITPDSLHLIPFKDNVDCYYGLKTIKNDTIFKPRFDRIEPLNDANMWAVYEGTKCRLMRPNGRFLTTPDMENVSSVRGEFKPSNNADYWEQWNYKDKLNDFPVFDEYYEFTIDKKYGIINRNGRVIVAPQQREINTLGDSKDSLFSFIIRETDDEGEEIIIEDGFINRKGESLFPNYTHTDVVSDNRYYQVSNVPKSLKRKDLEKTRFNIQGLVDSEGELILPCKFDGIHQIDTSDFFKVYLKTDTENQPINTAKGIFNVKTRRWLVDTSGKLSIDYTFDNAQFVVLRNENTKKYGLINDKGETIFPFVYDTLQVVNEKQQLFISGKNNKYQFLNVINKPNRSTYEALIKIPLEYGFNQKSEKIVPIFLAKSKNKWGIVDSNDQIIKPFIGDYAAHWRDNILLVENAKVHYFNEKSFPNEADVTDFFLGWQPKLYARSLAGNPKKLFFFNESGNVVIPPQYNSISSFNNSDRNQEAYILVEDAQKKRKLISTETGDILDFPFDYRLQVASKGSKLILVSDAKKTYYYHENRQLAKIWGVVTTEGRELTPCINAGIAIADAKIGTYFVRQDTPKVPFIPYLQIGELDTLGVGDNDWLWYNLEGKLIDSTAFRFPILFVDGLGVGMKGESFGIYRPDGSVFAPPQYKNIRRDRRTGFYYLFETQGMKMTVSLKKRDGTKFLKSGRYDAISPFYGKYALAHSSGKVGLIDSFGNEIIVPHDLLSFNSINLFDSLNLQNKQLDEMTAEERRKSPLNYRALPVGFSKSPYSPDSLNVKASLRNTIWHLMLEKVQDDALWQSIDFKIERSTQDIGVFYNLQQTCMSGVLDEEGKRHYAGEKIIASDSMVAFALKKGYRIPFFFNFHYKNNRWNEVTINDVLMIQGEKRWLFNDLLTRKVKALKDEEIDCSNASAFIAQVENRFMLKKEGIDFCFQSNKNGDDFVVVSFSWAELQPYLKMRF